ncbi:MAG TPA: 4-(cytidine 5'-diphospho)-2-C-methyl-D-erythritol kinase [Paracoccaceae bacterium]|nr:4-(cytidine 5'-diphospho)-2-C-methyl-D-erythritol kinase [Paracoccaceae bacterium]
MAADAAAGVIHRLAPAKVNLTLHLCGRRADGYHLLDSLVVFPEIGDRIEAHAAPGLSLEVSGPFAEGLSAGPDNLVLRAAAALAARHGVRQGAALHLVKNLPVASGIGGGSSDAAAALELLSRLWDVPVPDELALSLGADVPVCRAAPAPVRMQGIGDRLMPAPPLPGFWSVLVNPRVAVPTAAVFAGLRDRNPIPPPEMPGGGIGGFADFTAWLATQRNDLQVPATEICPAIGEVLDALSAAPLARMSGSGATCFALLPDQAQAEAQAEGLRRSRPGWWIAAAPVSAAAMPAG